MPRRRLQVPMVAVVQKVSGNWKCSINCILCVIVEVTISITTVIFRFCLTRILCPSYFLVRPMHKGKLFGIVGTVAVSTLLTTDVIRLHHITIWWRLLLLSVLLFFFSFFANEVYRTNMTHIQLWTPSGPKHTDPLSATLTHFSRSQTHFWPETRKRKIDITLSFMIRFWWNFVGMDLHRTPSWWPTYRWPWPTSSGQTRNRPEILCLRFMAKSTRRRIIPTTGLDAYC